MSSVCEIILFLLVVFASWAMHTVYDKSANIKQKTISSLQTLIYFRGLSMLDLFI